MAARLYSFCAMSLKKLLELFNYVLCFKLATLEQFLGNITLLALLL